MKKGRYFFLIAILLVAFGWWQIRPESYLSSLFRKNTFFIPTSITHFSESGIPMLSVQIENESVFAKLDLGFKGDLSLPAPTLARIQNKIPSGTARYYGAQGKSYSHNLYESPNFSIGKMMFSHATLREESMDFFQDSIVVWEAAAPPQIAPRLGWELFYNTNLFLDFQNSTVAFCDSFATLKTHIPGNFVKVPIHLDRGILEIDVQTDRGPLRCFLDTGTTWNLFNSPTQEVVSSPLKIGDQDFGIHPFHSFSLKFPFQVDALLGAEFFKTCRVFIDFRNRQAYFSRNAP